MSSIDARLSDALQGKRARGEELEPWFPTTEEHAREVRAALELENEMRLARATQKPDIRAEEAAARLEALLARMRKEATAAGNVMKRYATAAEVMFAQGFHGKAAAVKGSSPEDFKMKPGWLGGLPEVSFATEEQDVHEGFDLVVSIPSPEGAIRIGIDVTFSTDRLEEKFQKMGEGIELGLPTANNKTKDRPTTDLLKVVVGMSQLPMKDALREWGRDTDRREPYDAIAFGTRIREQIVAQLEAFATRAETHTQSKLAQRYRSAAEQLKKNNAKNVVSMPVRELADDPVHLAILEKARQAAQR